MYFVFYYDFSSLRQDVSAIDMLNWKILAPVLSKNMISLLFIRGSEIS